jgi:hypothetical protein
VPFIHVAERGDVFARHLGHVLTAAASDADEAEVELLVEIALSPDRWRTKPQHRPLR